MWDMAYCGYAEFLIVIIFIRLNFLLIVIFIIIFQIILGKRVYIIRFKLINSFFYLDFDFLFRVWRILFLFIVLMIRIRVLIFSFAYINNLNVNNFLILYIRFIFRMVWLIINNNFYWIILGWDGSGVVSFLLIVFYSNTERVNNGLFTLFQNRVGDLFFVFFIVGVLDLLMWNSLIVKYGILFLLLGRCVKSAQFPFNAWLLAAIRAPTPISSLVHSSTLVVAGVYILLQYSYCLRHILFVLKFIRILSLIMRSFGLINEGDIKKLIAYSTINHVSLMIFILRFELYKIVYFHLNIHAMFKSLIFICFGFVILSSYHAQDKRLISYYFINPIVKLFYYFSCLCLGGLPFLRAFFSKDLIIEKVIEFSIESLFIYLLLITLSLRVYYSLKLLKLNKVISTLNIVEKNFLGGVRVILIFMLIIIVINVYLSLVFSLTLEFFSNKIFIYLLIILIIFLRWLTNLNYKLNLYSKNLNWKEIWMLDLIKLDQFVYWNILGIMNYVSHLRRVKFILLINWWVIVSFIILF